MKSALVLLLAATGCVTARFHPRNGRAYASLTPRAVVINDDEAREVLAAGGQVIGSISSDGTPYHNTADLADRAAIVAAQQGGTHVVLTDRGEITSTYLHPATYSRECQSDYDGDAYACTGTAMPAHETSTVRPTAEFEVIRLAPELWGRLPDALRPGWGQAPPPGPGLLQQAGYVP